MRETLNKGLYAGKRRKTVVIMRFIRAGETPVEVIVEGEHFGIEPTFKPMMNDK